MSTAPPPRRLRVAVICEESGTVRDTFTRAGHDAVSVDLKPSKTPGEHHQGDALKWLRINARFLDLAILHPPCTYFTNAGVRWLYAEPDDSGYLKGIPRWKAMHEAARFWRALQELTEDVPMVAIENPTPHCYARDMVGAPDQTFHPYHFGHLEKKQTGLWLKGLPPLRHTSNLKAETMTLPPRQRNRIWYASPGKDRAEVRSVTYQGIADAMATQWGGLVVREQLGGVA